MAQDLLEEEGIFFDEFKKLRTLEPDVSQKTSELKEECKEFADSKTPPSLILYASRLICLSHLLRTHMIVILCHLQKSDSFRKKLEV